MGLNYEPQELRRKFSFDAALLGVLSGLGKWPAMTIRNLTISTVLDGLGEISSDRRDRGTVHH
jgi:hypothetical protein